MLKARAGALGIEDRIERRDLHLHFVDTELQKDGPSAGLALALAGFSAYAERPLRPRLAATGELTLHGAVRSGGRAAREARRRVPRGGRGRPRAAQEPLRALRTLPREVVARVEIVYTDSLSEGLEHALSGGRGG